MKKDRTFHEFSNASLQAGIMLAASESLGELANKRTYLPTQEI